MIYHSKIQRRLAILAMLSALSVASAQWTVSNLSPGGSTQSQVLGVEGGTLVGQVDFHAYWFGGVVPDLNPTVTDLLGPVTAESSIANGVDGNTIAGASVFNFVTKAGYWTTPGGSWTELHPSGAAFSMANAVSGGKQVGSAFFTGQSAYVWNGVAPGSDINPAGSTGSEALGIEGDDIVGYATIGGSEEASLWSGPTSTWASLAPGVISRALGVQGPTTYFTNGRQVGYVLNGTLRATMWQGASGPVTDLHPVGIDQFSAATAIDQDHQVGWVTGGVSMLQRAAIWKNTAASYIDLHAFLSPDFSDSIATAVYHTPTNTIVTGSGFNTVTMRQEALVWTGPPMMEPITWSNFLPPIKTNGSSIFKLKLPVPVWFRLTGDYEDMTNLDARLYVARVTNGEVGTEFEPDQFCAEDEGNRFRYFCGYYVYVLGTRNLSKGTYRLRVDLGDGVDHSVLITLKK